jgi:hypothetical protein
MKQVQYGMKPQDVVILLKIIALDADNWQQSPLAEALKMSQSEVSQSIARSKYAGLLDGKGKNVMRLAFIDFLQYGLAYVFPQKPGPVVRGMPTAHSAGPLNTVILSDELYVWPWVKGKVRGHSIVPLYSSVPEAAGQDDKLYELLALTDALRIGRARERDLAVNELKRRILRGE